MKGWHPSPLRVVSFVPRSDRPGKPPRKKLEKSFGGMKKSAYLCNAFPLKTTREGKTERSLKFFRYAGDEKVVQATVSLGAALYIINVYRSRDEKRRPIP